jgi:ubiquitin-protein ligase
LLGDANAADPLNPVAAYMYLNERKEFDDTALIWTEEFASPQRFARL